MAIEREGQISHELCLVPDKVDPLAVPIKVCELEPTHAAVFRVGTEESMTVVEQDGALILSGVEPALFFLTPNLSAFPGMRAKHLKVTRSADGKFRTFYSKDKAKWDEWTPSVERT